MKYLIISFQIEKNFNELNLNYYVKKIANKLAEK